MAIINLPGNFQPPQVERGRNLPQTDNHVTSTISTIDNIKSQASNVLNDNKTSTTNQSETQSFEVILNDKNIKDQAEAKTPIEELEQYNQSIDRTLQFKVDDTLGVTIVRVMDKETDELIRQFPPEELINLSRRLKELNDDNSGRSGILLQEKV